MHLEAATLSFHNLDFSNIKIQLPQNLITSDSLKAYNLQAEDITLQLDPQLDINGHFTFYEGQGHLSLDIGQFIEDSRTDLVFDIKGFNMNRLLADISEEIYISGFMDISGRLSLGEEEPRFNARFNSVRRRGVRQVMNFGAVKMIASIGGGGGVQIGRSNFGYSRIAGEIDIDRGYLTLKGNAGTRGDNEYIIRGGLFGGINLSIHRDFRTISMSYLSERLKSEWEEIAAEIR